MKRGWTAMLAVVVALMAWHAVRAGVPGQMHYQGRLTQADAPVSGAVAMEFLLFDALTGGTELFREAQTVAVSGGEYAVDLGSTVALAPELFRDHPSVYLEVRAAGQTLTPRERIVSVGYAFNAAHAQEADVARSLAPGAPMPLHVGSTTNVAFLAHMDSMNMEIGTNSEFLVDWQDVEYDTAGMFDTVADTFTVPVAGFYRLTAQANMLGGRDLKLAWLAIRWNGETNLTLYTHRMAGSGQFSMFTSRDAYLDSGDYVEVYVRQATIATQELNGTPWTTYFSGYLLQEE